MNTNTISLFEKRTVAELSEAELINVNGGMTPIATTALYSSEPCAIAAFAVITYMVG